MKTCSAEFGAVMMEGEFNSLKYMYTYIPESCPEPFGYGEVSCTQMLLPGVIVRPILLMGHREHDCQLCREKR